MEIALLFVFLSTGARPEAIDEFPTGFQSEKRDGTWLYQLRRVRK